jgi:hypothetical protein
MLFIPAIEVLARLFSTAHVQGIIHPLETQAIKHHCSLYADDIILFVHPEVREAVAVKEILRIFAEASGLKTNLNKCSITPIFGDQDSLPQLQSILGCRLEEFPITYLGLPLSTRKIPRAWIQSTIDAMARRLPAFHGPLMAWSGRLVWIKSVLAAIPIYTMLVDGLPPWARKEIDAICRRFLWTGKEESIRGKCMVAWATVCQPKDLGGLGVPDLHLTGIAQQTRWLSLCHTDEQRAWSELPISVPSDVQAFFSASTYTIIENGRTTRFWMG